jgi:hypothetical protein
LARANTPCKFRKKSELNQKDETPRFHDWNWSGRPGIGLLNSKGTPNFYVNFYILNARGEYAGVTMFEGSDAKFAICNENGPQTLSCAGLLPGKPAD